MWARQLDCFSLTSCVSETLFTEHGLFAVTFSSAAHKSCAETVATMSETLPGGTSNLRNTRTAMTRSNISDQSTARTNRRSASIFPEADTSACFYEMLLQVPQCVLR